MCDTKLSNISVREFEPTTLIKVLVNMLQKLLNYDKNPLSINNLDYIVHEILEGTLILDKFYREEYENLPQYIKDELIRQDDIRNAPMYSPQGFGNTKEFLSNQEIRRNEIKEQSYERLR
jgi:hypothetical protein